MIEHIGADPESIDPVVPDISEGKVSDRPRRDAITTLWAPCEGRSIHPDRLMDIPSANPYAPARSTTDTTLSYTYRELRPVSQDLQPPPIVPDGERERITEISEPRLENTTAEPSIYPELVTRVYEAPVALINTIKEIPMNPTDGEQTLFFYKGVQVDLSSIEPLDQTPPPPAVDHPIISTFTEVIEGLPFESLENVLYYKRKMSREKDKQDIQIIEALKYGQ